jgi:hypothetical protein
VWTQFPDFLSTLPSRVAKEGGSVATQTTTCMNHCIVVVHAHPHHREIVQKEVRKYNRIGLHHV